MKSSIGSYSRPIIGGMEKGDFSIYQARNGKIYLLMGNRAVPLTKQQINNLCLDIFSLIDFSYDDYINAYTETK